MCIDSGLIWWCALITEIVLGQVNKIYWGGGSIEPWHKRKASFTDLVNDWVMDVQRGWLPIILMDCGFEREENLLLSREMHQVKIFHDYLGTSPLCWLHPWCLRGTREPHQRKFMATPRRGDDSEKSQSPRFQCSAYVTFHATVR